MQNRVQQGRRRLTDLAQQLIIPHLPRGGTALDATAGNGHDTLFLARRVGDSGRVFSFDIQTQAITATAGRLAKAGVSEKVALIEASHARLDELLPTEIRERLDAVVYNLGYLPGADRTITTTGASTITSLQQASRWLAPGGIISILAYVGHPGGLKEAEEVERWLFDTARGLTVKRIRPDGLPASAPRLFTAVKNISTSD